ncbi:MAG: FAD:protein FMN transferase, partial [Planctomycetota bacterium]|nr:FAD:protein FMN transferase [Planctomycetota bacterium]
TAEALAAARAKIGATALKLDTTQRQLTRTRAGLVIDVSAVGKGYGVDRIGLALEALGYSRYLVEIGGEVRARGLNRLGRPWTIGVEKPDGGAQDVTEIVPLPDLSIATSGNYRNFHTLDGKIVTHIIDARNGQPVSHGLGSVSVLAPSCMRADALATAFYVLGEDEGFAIAERDGIPALFLTPARGDQKGQKTPRRRATTAYKQLLKGTRTPQ